MKFKWFLFMFWFTVAFGTQDRLVDFLNAHPKIQVFSIHYCQNHAQPWVLICSGNLKGFN